MSQTVSQIIFFRVKSSVKPEDPVSEEGEALLKIFRTTQQQSGHKHSSWGRTVEDKDTIVWVIDWTDPRSTINIHLLEPFLAPENPQPPSSLHVTFSPPLSCTETLTKNPVTELCTLSFPSDLDVLATRQINADLISFRTTLVEQLPQSAGPRSWSMGHVDRPSKLTHEKSPSGQAFAHVLAVGWENGEAHLKAKETEKFVQGIAPLREKMLPPIPGLEIKHISFQKIEG
ncbi:Isocitrate dehydrogenase kinase/phosphatase [Penicillium digitatum]|uniref:Isocitrate dehydrogenase kinase/phosphatase n=1 Tax=Penicillium digitatum TaxID=36651 RepID=A0A7T7BK41_PENDI|nr:Isocitrate dehydrogenase kinase/phosphatase [Penicillium digitatum]